MVGFTAVDEAEVRVNVWSRIAVAALAFAVVVPPAAAVARADAPGVADHTRRSTAYVAARVSDRSEAVGAGVMLAVSPNVIVLTARHLAARKNLSLRTFAGEQLRIVAEYEVADRDVALIVASGACTGCEAAETADAITVGEPIHVWGNPQGRHYVMSPGTIADLRPAIPGYEANGRFALVCDSCDVGDSGGGVFDERGRLLGIITEGWDGLDASRKRVIAEPANHALARIPLEYIARTDAVPKRETSPSASVARIDGGRTTRWRVRTRCAGTEVVSQEISAAVNANLLAQLPQIELDAAREARTAAARAVQQCAGMSGSAGTVTIKSRSGS
jgi:hypothetical protein